jgi:hypothetical protein
MVVPVVVCLFDHPIDPLEIGRVVQRHMAVFKGVVSAYLIRLRPPDVGAHAVIRDNIYPLAYL